MFPLMFGILLMQLNCHAIMEWMGLTFLHFLHCAPRKTPPHFVVEAMKLIVLSVLTHTLMGTNWLIWHNRCHMC